MRLLGHSLVLFCCSCGGLIEAGEPMPAETPHIVTVQTRDYRFELHGANDVRVTDGEGFELLAAVTRDELRDFYPELSVYLDSALALRDGAYRGRPIHADVFPDNNPGPQVAEPWAHSSNGPAHAPFRLPFAERE